MPTKTLVTGGAGFIGSHLCDRLLAEDNEVIVIDDFSTGRADNIDHLLSDPRFRLVEHDVTKPMPSAVRRMKPARIYHLACSTGPHVAEGDPVQTALTSLLGAKQTLEFAQSIGARMLQASTCEVYGDPAVHPQPEHYHGNVNPGGPRACYGEAKRCAEMLCQAYQTTHGLDIRIARIFNTYGPRMRSEHGGVVGSFVDCALRGIDLDMHSDGTQTRSFCYVEDMVSGLMALMESDLNVPVNLGNPEEHNLLHLAEQVLRLTGSHSRLKYGPARLDDPHRRRPDTTLAESRLGWRPRVPLRQGLQHTVEWFREQVSAEGVTTYPPLPITASMPLEPFPGTRVPG